MQSTHWPRYSSKILEMLHKCDSAIGSSAVPLLGNSGLKAIYSVREEAAKPSKPIKVINGATPGVLFRPTDAKT
jgi:hypothetical protein